MGAESNRESHGHWSDCAVNNAPSLEPGPCDCGGLKLTDDVLHHPIVPPVTRSWGLGSFVQDGESKSLIQPEKLPPNGFVVDAAAANLPDTHHGVAFLGSTNSVDLHGSGKTVVSDFKASPRVQCLAGSLGEHFESPTEITSEMIEAGVSVLLRWNEDRSALAETVREIYLAMRQVEVDASR